MQRSVLGLGIAALVLAAVAIFLYTGDVSANNFNNGNISFDYPSNFILDKNPVADENSTGYFVCAINSPSTSSTIVIYQIPLTTTKNVTSNNTTRSNTTSGNNSSNSTNNTLPFTNTTLNVTVNNLQVYLDGVKTRNGQLNQVIKNNYTLYVSGNLSSPLANYTSLSRLSKIYSNFTINETAVVKPGAFNFYVIEIITGNSTAEDNKAYQQVVNTFKIL